MESIHSARLTEPTPELIDRVKIVLNDGGYEMEEMLGQGGYSIVYCVFSLKYQRKFAAKVTDISTTPARQACERETFALQRLRHPNIVNLYDSWVTENYSILIFELCSKQSIKTLINNAKGQPIPNCLRLMEQLCEAVHHLHSHNIAHRDIKPHNILLDDHGRAKLADFGLAVFQSDSTSESHFSGTMKYSPPEVLRHEDHDIFKTDIWALGVTFYEMYKGTIRWPEGTDIGSAIATGGIFFPNPLPQSLQRLVVVMTRMNPAKRPAIDEIIARGEIQRRLSHEEKAEPMVLERRSSRRRTSIGRGPTPLIPAAQQSGLIHRPLVLHSQR
jgi:serine/threonine protein kinase